MATNAAAQRWRHGELMEIARYSMAGREPLLAGARMICCTARPCA